MIARVRQRVRANSVTINNDKTAQTVCLLSAILLLPYCPRGPLPLLPSSASILYSVFVLPIVLSANYRYPLPTLKSFIRLIRVSAKTAWHPLRGFIKRIYGPIERAENLFLEMKHFSVMSNQIVFLLLADKLLMVDRSKSSSLYTLMFYNVIAYCVSYIKELIEKDDVWSPYVTLTERSQIKHLAMSATKIVLEWTKAVTFIVTLTFMLLVFGMEYGLERYKPSTVYTIITWIYYSATEKVFVDMFPTILRLFQLDALENIEQLYAPVILQLFTIVVSAIFTLFLIPRAIPVKLLVIAIYINVYLRWKELAVNSGAALNREREILNRYRKATLDEIEKFDDVCAVCLCAIVKARITPCHHLFHADCLRQCLKTSDACPMCKRQLKFD